MEGFFTKKEIVNKAKNPYLSCISCGLHKGCASPKMEPYGENKRRIMLIGEFPNKHEDQRDIPWEGSSGRLLVDTLSKLGIDVDEDCVSLFAVNCHPPAKHNPNGIEVKCCRNVKVNAAIEKYKPKLIILLGQLAVMSVIGEKWKDKLGNIMKWRGWTIPDYDLGAWVCPVFSPNYVSIMEAKEIMTVWRQDLDNALNKLDEPLPKYNKPNVEIIENLQPLSDIKSDIIAFDYEDTGLKPQAKGHRIVSCSVAYDADNAYSFLIPKDRRERKPLIDLLMNLRIYKIAANMKHEDTWTILRLGRGVEVKNWAWDTMLGAHLLDNRPGIAGLKFQALVQFGVYDYASSVSPYLKSVDGTANGKNTVEKLITWEQGKNDLLLYGGYDAIYEYRLAHLQMKLIDWDFMYF